MSSIRLDGPVYGILALLDVPSELNISDPEKRAGELSTLLLRVELHEPLDRYSIPLSLLSLVLNLLEDLAERGLVIREIQEQQQRRRVRLRMRRLDRQ